ncbi:hypothetical protein Tco_0957570 [Tanacetum coccineum]
MKLFAIESQDLFQGKSQYGNHVRSLLRLLLPAAIVEKPKDADTEMEQEKFEAAMILATGMEISEIEAKKGLRRRDMIRFILNANYLYLFTGSH